MTSATVSVLYLVAGLSVQTTLAQNGRVGDRWFETAGPGFIVISDGEANARAAAHTLEDIRALLRSAMGTAHAEPRTPVLVVAVNTERSFRELLPPFGARRGRRLAAAYWKGPHRHNVVVRVDSSEDEVGRRLLHEYVHLLTAEQVPDAPAWLNEGLSEFWAASTGGGAYLRVGAPPPNHLKRLRAHAWIPMHELLAIERAPDSNNQRKLDLFYAQSWALTHYLMLGRGNRGDDLPLAPSSYVEQLRKGADPVAAAEALLGTPLQLQRRLREYVRTNAFRPVQLAAEGASRQPDLTVRVLPAAESLAVRATVLLDGQRHGAARPLLEEALRLDAHQPLALETMGRLHFQENDPTEAARWFDRAILYGSAGHLVYYYRAVVWAAAGGNSKTLANPSGPEHLLGRAIELNSRFAPAYARLANLYSQGGVGLEAVLPLMRRATELEPENASYWVELGSVLSRLHRSGEAREALKQGLAQSRSARGRRLLELALADLESPDFARFS